MWTFDEAKKYLEEWPIWIGLIFLFIPGILHQIEYKSVNVVTFQGSLIIIFLFLSLYYSTPYLIFGSLFCILFNPPEPRYPTKFDFLQVSLTATIFYWFLFKLESYYPFPHQTTLFTFLLIILVLVLLKRLYEEKYLKKKK